MTIPIALLIFSVIFRAIAQTERFRQPRQSWLYKTFLLDFNTPIPILDAKHFWKGAKEVTLFLGAYLFPTTEWHWLILILFLYWQLFNLFFHVVFVYRFYWEYPFLRLTYNGWINFGITIIVITLIIIL